MCRRTHPSRDDAGSLNLDIFRFQPLASASAVHDACEFDECSGLFDQVLPKLNHALPPALFLPRPDPSALLDQVAGTEDTLVQWHAHATDATRATVFIATANVIKTLALMRASQVRRRVLVHPPLLNVYDPVRRVTEPTDGGGGRVWDMICQYLTLHGAALKSAAVCSRVDPSNTQGTGEMPAEVTLTPA